MTDTTFELQQEKLNRALAMMMRVDGELVESSAMQPEATAPGWNSMAVVVDSFQH